MDTVKIGKCIAAARKRCNLTQEELAVKVGVSMQAVSKWENGHNLLDIDNLMLIAAILLHDVVGDMGVKSSEMPFSDEVKEIVSLVSFAVEADKTKEQAKDEYYA